jgi:hypothetical protein
MAKKSRKQSSVLSCCSALEALGCDSRKSWAPGVPAALSPRDNLPMQLTRRELAGALATATAALAQPQAPASDDPKELLQAAVARLRRASDRLEKIELPMAAEPAFSFKP